MTTLMQPAAPKTARSTGRATRFSLATSLRDVLDAWRFLYGRYIAAGFISENRYGIHMAPCAIGPHASVTLARQDGKVVGTITTISDNPAGFPMEKIYPMEIQQLRRDGCRVAEMGLFADHREEQANAFNMLFDLMRYAFFAAVHDQATDIICGICPRHARTYRRVLGFRQIGEETTYSAVGHAPVVLLRGNIQQMFQNAARLCAVNYFVQNPLARDIYTDRFSFSAYEIATSPLQAILYESRIRSSALNYIIEEGHGPLPVDTKDLPWRR